MIRLLFLFLLIITFSGCQDNKNEKTAFSPPSYEPNDESQRKKRAKNKIKAITDHTTLLRDTTYASARLGRREFDREGRMIKWEHYTKGEENSIDSLHYEWDRHRQLLTLTAWYSHGLSESPLHGTNIYSNAGQLIGINYDRSKDGTYNGRIIYQYNSAGLLAKEIRAHRENTLIHVSEYFYDSLGYRIMTIKDGDTVCFTWDHEKNISYRKLPDRKIEYHYNANGDLILELVTIASGEPISYTKYWYDTNGDLIAELFHKYRLYNEQQGCLVYTDTPVNEIRYKTYKHEFYD